MKVGDKVVLKGGSMTGVIVSYCELGNPIVRWSTGHVSSWQEDLLIAGGSDE
jgi:hypothetical protein